MAISTPARRTASLPPARSAASSRATAQGGTGAPIDAILGTEESEVTGMMPGSTGLANPRSARPARSERYSAASKKNWVTAKSARASFSASRSRSATRSDEVGWPAGWAATPMENPPTARASSTSSSAWASSPGPSDGSSGGSPPSAIRFSTPALR